MTFGKVSSKLYLWLHKAVVLALFAYSCFYVPAAYAQPNNAAGMLMNIAQTVPAFMQLVTATAYVMGMWFVIMGVNGLKHFGEARASHSPEHSLKGPLIQMTVGTLLLYLPSSVQSGLETFWTNPSPYAYTKEAADQWSVLIQDSYSIMQFIGTVAVIRGFLILNQLAGQAQPGTFGRALTHIIAGILCINIYGFLQMLNATLGVVPQ